MQELKKLPVGFENFQEIRKLDFYYVESEFIYQTTPIWKNLKYEYA